MIKYGFIGAGNMGGALARALRSRVEGSEILINDKDVEKAEKLAVDISGKQGDVHVLASSCRYIFIAVKPQVLPVMFDEIKGDLAARRDRFVLVSMAAGVTVASIKEYAGGDYPVIRIMPSLPASVGQGMILYTADDGVFENEIEEFVSDMSCAGIFDRIPEKLIDAGSAVSGCGPAFVYMFAEAMADGGVACGLPRDKALTYAYQTLAGAASLLKLSDKHPGKLKDEVCSPGGSTIQGVLELERSAFRSAVSDAVIASYEKTVELGKK